MKRGRAGLSSAAAIAPFASKPCVRRSLQQREPVIGENESASSLGSTRDVALVGIRPGPVENIFAYEWYFRYAGMAAGQYAIFPDRQMVRLQPGCFANASRFLPVPKEIHAAGRLVFAAGLTSAFQSAAGIWESAVIMRKFGGESGVGMKVDGGLLFDYRPSCGTAPSTPMPQGVAKPILVCRHICKHDKLSSMRIEDIFDLPWT